jgi:hypothetical protein
MVTMRSQIAERRVQIVPHTNAQQKKKMKKKATEMKTEKTTDNKDNKANNPKDWGDFVQIQEFFLCKKFFPFLWSNNKVHEHGMTIVLQDWPTKAFRVLFALNFYCLDVKKWMPQSRIVANPGIHGYELVERLERKWVAGIP